MYYNIATLRNVTFVDLYYIYLDNAVSFMYVHAAIHHKRLIYSYVAFNHSLSINQLFIKTHDSELRGQ